MSVQVFDEDCLDSIFSALSHPIRRHILTRLKEGKATVTELGDPFDVTLPAITKHIKILENANLINRSQVAQLRYSHLNPGPLREARDWLEAYEEFWKQKFDRLEDYVTSNLEKEEQ